MPFGIGIWEVLILLLVVLLVFGPKRLPEMGRSLGRGMREFKDSISGKDFEDDEPAQKTTFRASSRASATPSPKSPAPWSSSGCRGACATVKRRRSWSTSASCARGC
jgi:sec-independent protein translocase protein TatA